MDENKRGKCSISYISPGASKARIIRLIFLLAPFSRGTTQILDRDVIRIFCPEPKETEHFLYSFS